MGFRLAGEKEKLRQAVVPPDPAVGHGAQEEDPLGDPQFLGQGLEVGKLRAFSDVHQEDVLLLGDPGHRLQDHVKALLLPQAAHGDEAPFPLGPGGGGGEGGLFQEAVVYAGGDDPDGALYAVAFRQALHGLRGGDDHLHPVVEALARRGTMPVYLSKKARPGT